jgi:hypothetical protein
VQVVVWAFTACDRVQIWGSKEGLDSYSFFFYFVYILWAWFRMKILFMYSHSAGLNSPVSIIPNQYYGEGCKKKLSTHIVWWEYKQIWDLEALKTW